MIQIIVLFFAGTLTLAGVVLLLHKKMKLSGDREVPAGTRMAIGGTLVAMGTLLGTWALLFSQHMLTVLSRFF